MLLAIDHLLRNERLQATLYGFYMRMRSCGVGYFRKVHTKIFFWKTLFHLGKFPNVGHFSL